MGKSENTRKMNSRRIEKTRGSQQCANRHGSSVFYLEQFPSFVNVLFDKYWSQEEEMSISCFPRFPVLYNSYILLMWAGGSPGRDKVIAANDAP